MTVKDRLLQYLQYLGVGQTRFEKDTGLANGYVNNIGKKPKLKTLERITDKYPDFNLNWLITGQGSMLLKSDSDTAIDDGEIRQEATINVLTKIVLQREAAEKKQTIRKIYSEFNKDVDTEIEMLRSKRK